MTAHGAAVIPAPLELVGGDQILLAGCHLARTNQVYRPCYRQQEQPEPGGGEGS